MSTTDDLTGLLTRAAFHDQLENFARAHDHLVIVHMDLDHMMAVNNQYGHVGGDAWIRAIATLFGEVFAQTEEGPGLVCRYGGDEMLALVPCHELYAIYEKAEQLRLRIAQNPPEVVAGEEVLHPTNTISLGLAAYPANASDPNDLLEKGKEALYRAKQMGGNQVCFYQENDSLTGLASFVASQRALGETLAQCRQKGEPLSIFLIDIDRFKEINDEYGHRAGDEVLKRLAHILSSNFHSEKNAGVARLTSKDAGQTNSIGRIAGDEFVVVMPGQPADSAFILAEEVRRLVEDSAITITLGSRESGTRTLTVRFTISGGIASYPNDGSERVDLLRKADEALYRSKRIGRNRISLPTSAQMITKTSYYTQIQLERLGELARKMDKTEAFLLREALDDLLRKYDPAGQG